MVARPESLPAHAFHQRLPVLWNVCSEQSCSGSLALRASYRRGRPWGSLSHIFFFLGSGMSLVGPTRMTRKFITSGILLEPRRMNQIWSENPAPLDRNQQYGGLGPDKQEPWVDVGSGHVFCAQGCLREPPRGHVKAPLFV